jgi:glyoxylase-like metal-dependent hydrolase (beta-lactamase superfamily II)
MSRKTRSKARAALARGLGAIALAATVATAAGAAEIANEEIRDGVWLFTGAGSNVIALADGDELLVIDGGLDANSADLLAAIRAATGAERIAVLIDTHAHPEQVGLNDEAGADGARIIAHEHAAQYLRHAVSSPLYEDRFGPLPETARPTETTSYGGTFEFGGHRVNYGYLPAAHTDGDLYVYVMDLDILAAGGAVGSDAWPLLDYWNGGLIGGLVRAHETLSHLVGDDTVVIPAHGPAMTGADLMRQRDVQQQLFRDLNFLMNKGMGYDDVVALNPLEGREPALGDPSRFLDGAYRSKLMSYVPD